MAPAVAAFDIGKTNLKLVVTDGAGRRLASRTAPNAPQPPTTARPWSALDVAGAWRFVVEGLRELAAPHGVGAIVFSTHGAAGALVDDDGEVAAPLDYEFDGFGDDGYAALRPPFAQTLSPALPRGLTLGRQIHFVERSDPAAFARATAFLAYPQYWAWRLGGRRASEVTSLGCHTDLWNPVAGRFSTLVEARGWTRLFPPLALAWDRL
ncbi:MAG: hypothetical protein KGQ28_11255, partial [Hyphomicrobiales bacterium]|nr:hypothetical protein [Hyphomicrobiales bacterium]